MANIVIVGGTEEAQLILRGLLRLHQHRIIGGSVSPAAALDQLRQANNPVLLLDADMTRPSWTDFVPQARQANPATHVVLLTPTRSVRLDAQARSLGVAALVRRPFAIQELLTAVGPTSAPPASAPSAPPPSTGDPSGG